MLFLTLITPAISYGCEVLGSQCHGSLVSGAKTLQGVQLAFLHNVCDRCMLTFLQLLFLLSWLKTHAVSR